MVFAHGLAHDAGRFFEGRAVRQAQFAHGVDDPPLHRLQPIPHIRQRALDNDRHRVADIRIFHLIFNVDGLDMLVRRVHATLSAWGIWATIFARALRNKPPHEAAGERDLREGA